MLVQTKILDATPGVIEKYALNDEQALLAKLRYNRASCKTLQNSMVKTCPSGSSMTIFATEATRYSQIIDLTRFYPLCRRTSPLDAIFPLCLSKP
jgi:hypothetical protein